MSMILVSNEQSGHYLMHYRTKGSKNGVRLYQNEDGSLTPLGREHYGIGKNRRYDRLESSITKNTSNASKNASKAAKIKSTLDKDDARMLKGKSSMSDLDRTKLLKKYYKLNTKSLAYQRKAERGKYKLMKFLNNTEKLYYEGLNAEDDLAKKSNAIVDRMLEHADSGTDLKAFLNSLTEEQRNALYVIFDDLLPDDDEQLEQNDTDGAYLMHYRTKGSKNGVRLYQNEDGSLTPLGREHYGIGEGRKGGESSDDSSDDSGAESEPKKPSFRQRIKERRHAIRIDRKAHKELQKAVDSEKKNIRNLTDTELQDRINRLNKEKQLSQLLDESVNRDVSPLRQKAEKIISDAAEDLAKKTLSTVTQSIVDKLSKKLKGDEPFKLDKYRDADLLKLKSDEIAKIVTAFDQVGRVAENRAKALKKPDGSAKEESKSESKPASDSSSTPERTIGKNTKKKIRKMKGEGKSAAEIASALGLTEESIKPFM